MLLPHQLDVAEGAGVVGRAVAQLPAVDGLAGPPVQAGALAIAYHVVAQLCLAFTTRVSFTQAPAFSIISDSFPTISAVDGEALVPLALAPAVHAVQAPALGLPGLQVASAVVETLEPLAGFLFNTRWT